MSRLDSFIRRLEAQRACLNLAATLIDGLDGAVLELGRPPRLGAELGEAAPAVHGGPGPGLGIGLGLAEDGEPGAGG
jgi:hypothetical protein